MKIDTLMETQEENRKTQELLLKIVEELKNNR